MANSFGITVTQVIDNTDPPENANIKGTSYNGYNIALTQFQAEYLMGLVPRMNKKNSNIKTSFDVFGMFLESQGADITQTHFISTMKNEKDENLEDELKSQ